jgi:hypothetical protein
MNDRDFEEIAARWHGALVAVKEDLAGVHTKMLDVHGQVTEVGPLKKNVAMLDRRVEELEKLNQTMVNTAGALLNRIEKLEAWQATWGTRTEEP